VGQQLKGGSAFYELNENISQGKGRNWQAQNWMRIIVGTLVLCNALDFNWHREGK
jgi:hypothetical protein